MYTMTRFEQYVMYYWTGSQWSTNKSNAKLFNTRDEANKEKKANGIKWTVQVNKA